MDTEEIQVDEIRAFNRFYTRLVGALDASHLQSPFTLTEARVLYEVANRETTAAADLARRMGIDPAQMSRLLAKLRDSGHLTVQPNVADRRAQDIGLTDAGRNAFASLDADAAAAVAALLRPLAPVRRQALTAAMATIRGILDDALPAAPLIIRPHRAGDVAYVVSRQGRLYADEHGWDLTYEGLAAEIAGQLQDFDPACECCLIAERRGEIVGSVFVVYAGEGLAQLRLLYVEPSARGLGIGRTLVSEAVKFARASGYAQMTLWTQSMLVSARKIYAASGFVLVRDEPHQSFGKDLVGEYWERDLTK